jgi:asparagine synthase (glutamine-hydrolysing)
MCGIFGVYRRHGRIDLRAVARANRLQRHRGPDDSGYLLWRRPDRLVQCGDADTVPNPELSRFEAYEHEPLHLALAFRRLSIQDPSPRSHQPIKTTDGRIWMVFNGEIYNFVETSPRVGARGSRLCVGR